MDSRSGQGMPGIPAFFAGRHVLVTGATGFMGKVLVEKILRSCPDVATVFVVVRPKRGQEPNDRIKDLRHLPVFGPLLKANPNAFDKIHALAGETTQVNMGLSEADQRLVQDKVSVVFHLAAALNWTVPLRTAVRENVGGTKNMLEFCKRINNLVALEYTSTTFCQCGEEVLHERLYPAPYNPHRLLEICEIMDDEVVESMAKTYPVRAAPQLLHVHQGAGRVHGGRVQERAAPARHQARHRDPHVQGPDPRLGGYAQRAHGGLGGGGQGRAALHDVQRLHQRRGLPRRRLHQRHHGRHLPPQPAAPHPPRSAGVQRLLRPRHGDDLGRDPGDRQARAAQVPLRVGAVVPGRRHPHQLVVAPAHRALLPGHPRLLHRRPALPARPEAIHGARPEEDPLRPRPAGLLHDARVEVREQEWLHQPVAEPQRRGQADLLPQQRAARRQGGLHREGHHGHQDVLPEGVARHPQVLPKAPRRATRDPPDLRRPVLHDVGVLRRRPVVRRLQAGQVAAFLAAPAAATRVIKIAVIVTVIAPLFARVCDFRSVSPCTCPKRLTDRTLRCEKKGSKK